jgi:hypothetical protein
MPCHIVVKMCPVCKTETESRLVLCDFGKSGRVCVGANTVSGGPSIVTHKNTVDGVVRADMVYIVASEVSEKPCGMHRNEGDGESESESGL